jgi:hypothetical protein
MKDYFKEVITRIVVVTVAGIIILILIEIF